MEDRNMYNQLKSRGIVKYQKGGMVNTTGYTPGTSTFNNPYNIIPSGDITMKSTPFKVMGIDNLGTKQLMMPGKDYKFPGSHVLEIPQYQTGGQVNKQRIGNSNIYFDSNKTWTGPDGQLTASDLATGKHYGITRNYYGEYNFKGAEEPVNYTRRASENINSMKVKVKDFLGIKDLKRDSIITEMDNTFRNATKKEEFNPSKYARKVKDPIYTSNKNDPRIANYQDSLYLHDKSLEQLALPGKNVDQNFVSDFSAGDGSRPKKIKNNTYLNTYTKGYDNMESFDLFNNKLYPEGTIAYTHENNDISNLNAFYPNPIQPVYYKEKDKPIVMPKPTPKGYPQVEDKSTSIAPSTVSPQVDKTKVGMYRVRINGQDKYITKSEYEAYLKKGKTSTSKTGQVLDKSKYELRQ
jgi:hypothetical protein